MDAAGKDGTIKHVMSGVNPQGCQVFSFKQPSDEELDHNFLWRCWKAVPERGRIGIFNRSYYEEVLVVRVHPEFLAAQRLPEQKVRRAIFGRPATTTSTTSSGTSRATARRSSSSSLHISKEEQRQRFLARLEDPEKHWKFSAKDVAERRPLGRIHARVRGSDHRHQHRVGPLAHHSGRSQMGQPGAGGEYHRHHDQVAELGVSADRRDKRAEIDAARRTLQMKRSQASVLVPREFT